MGTESESLCWRCKKSCNGGCSWSASFIPVEGWTFVKRNTEADGVCVLRCPEFERETKRPSELDEMGCQNLIAGIIRLAVNDYIHAEKLVRRKDNDEKSPSMLRCKIERFIRSEYFSRLSEVDPEWLIGKLRKEVENKKRK